MQKCSLNVITKGLFTFQSFGWIHYSSFTKRPKRQWIVRSTSKIKSFQEIWAWTIVPEPWWSSVAKFFIFTRLDIAKFVNIGFNSLTMVRAEPAIWERMVVVVVVGSVDDDDAGDDEDEDHQWCSCTAWWYVSSKCWPHGVVIPFPQISHGARARVPCHVPRILFNRTSD